VEWSDVFREEVLKKWLDPMDLAMLARACWKCGEAVASAGIVRAGVHGMPFKLVTCFASGELLAWAKANRCRWASHVCELAAKYGVEALQWARALDFPWDVRTCASPVRYGHLAALLWARDHGCPWDGTTCEGAALGGHLNVLRWAREQSIYVRSPPGAGTWIYCSGHGRTAVRAPSLISSFVLPPRAGTLR
jgi:hypothetical protein